MTLPRSIMTTKRRATRPSRRKPTLAKMAAMLEAYLWQDGTLSLAELDAAASVITHPSVRKGFVQDVRQLHADLSAQPKIAESERRLRVSMFVAEMVHEFDPSLRAYARQRASIRAAST